MKVAQQPQKPPDGSNQNWATTSGKKDTASDSMYIATRRARLEAREAGFLVCMMVSFGEKAKIRKAGDLN